MSHEDLLAVTKSTEGPVDSWSREYLPDRRSPLCPHLISSVRLSHWQKRNWMAACVVSWLISLPLFACQELASRNSGLLELLLRIPSYTQ